MATRRVGIVGCGTAGQASAILLARQGWEVSIFERVRIPAPVGAGLLIQPTGTAVLRTLGVLEELSSLATPVHRLFGTTHHGKAVFDLSYRDLGEDLHGFGVHRGAVSNALQRAVLAEDVSVRFGIDVVSTPTDGTKRWIVDSDGGMSGPFDLVLVCDGSKSVLRTNELLRSDRDASVVRDVEYPWSALWFIGENDGRYDGTLRQVFRSTRQFIGFLPTGRVSRGAPSLVSMFWSIRNDTIDHVLRGSLGAFKDTVRDLTDLADPLLDQMRSLDQLIVAKYRDVMLRPMYGWSRYSTGAPIVFLGDAAHAMSPQLGQGANLALVDAFVFAQELERHAVVNDAIEAFTRIRSGHTRFYQFASRWLTPVFQSDLTLVGPMRDRAMPILSRWKWSRKHALQTLAGVKTGLLTASPLPERA